MLKRFHLPIRFKILITLLFVVTCVVGIITFMMARMFHTDKTTYIHDLTSVVASQTAAEANTVLKGYVQRLNVFARVIYDQDMASNQKSSMLKKLFEDSADLISVTVSEEGREDISIFDSKTLQAAGVSREMAAKYRERNPLPLESIRAGKVYIENSTFAEKLPSIAVAIPYTSSNSSKTAVISAFILMDELSRITKQSAAFEAFIMDKNGKILVHSDMRLATSKAPVNWIPNLQGLKTGRSSGGTMEYSREGVDLVGGFAPIETGGVLAVVQIPKSTAYLTARELLNNLVGVSLVLLVIAAVIGTFWSRRLTRPLEGLSKAANVVGSGRFDIQVESSSNDEIGELASSFNQMATELNSREEALKEAQEKLVQSEKMSAFGQLSAGIAHEVKNPLAGILGYTQLSMRKVEKDTVLYKNLEVIEKETKRTKTIIENLMKFARQEKAMQEPIDINQVVEDAMAIVNHQLTINNVKPSMELAQALPRIIGNANQLQQVLMNLMINAQQAMDGKPGEVKVTTGLLDSRGVEIRVSDTGPGIPKEIQAKIFEPFFTTKPVGKGTGLGLSVTFGIIRDHKGEIRVESEPGQGATFIIELPIEFK